MMLTSQKSLSLYIKFKVVMLSNPERLLPVFWIKCYAGSLWYQETKSENLIRKPVFDVFMRFPYVYMWKLILNDRTEYLKLL